MAQATILATGTTGATSTDVAVAAGSAVNVGIFGDAGLIVPQDVDFEVMMDSPGGDVLVTLLNADQRVVSLKGPGTYRVVRPSYSGNAFGVFSEA